MGMDAERDKRVVIMVGEPVCLLRGCDELYAVEEDSNPKLAEVAIFPEG